MSRKGLTAKMAFEQKAEGSMGVSHMESGQRERQGATIVELNELSREVTGLFV